MIFIFFINIHSTRIPCLQDYVKCQEYSVKISLGNQHNKKKISSQFCITLGMYDFCNNGKTTSILKMTDLYIYLPGEESTRGNIVCLHKPICGGNWFSKKLPNFGSETEANEISCEGRWVNWKTVISQEQKNERFKVHAGPYLCDVE